MSDDTSSQVRLRDPLSDVTRKERRSLLAVSTLGIVMGGAGLVPERIAGLGIEFTSIDQRAILMIGMLIVLYFLLAFCIYAWSDFIAWRTEIDRKMIPEVMEEYEREIRGYSTGMDQMQDHLDEYRSKLEAKARKVLRFIRPTSFLRLGFDIGLPIAVGVTAMLLLIASSRATLSLDTESTLESTATTSEELLKAP